MTKLSNPPQVHTATYEFEAGPIRSRASASITTGGLLAVAAILLAVVPIILAATAPARLRARGGGNRVLPKRDQ